VAKGESLMGWLSARQPRSKFRFLSLFQRSALPRRKSRAKSLGFNLCEIQRLKPIFL
jgi:hypothetical protein